MPKTFKYYYGTRAGGAKMSTTIRAKYGDDFWKKIGHTGGSHGHDGGFRADPALAKTAGAKGGRHSHRWYKLIFTNSDGTRYYRHAKTSFLYKQLVDGAELVKLTPEESEDLILNQPGVKL